MITSGLEYSLGPMEGICDRRFVRVVSRMKLVDRWTTPFLRVSSVAIPRRTIRAFIGPFAESGADFVLQLMGTSPSLLAGTAANAAALGVRGFDFNCGCPSKRVCSGGAGGGMLRTPELMTECITAVKDAIGGLPLSVKMRSGFSDDGHIADLVGRIAGSGAVSKIYFHYRTVRELYAPAAGRERRFETAVRAAGDVPVVINGDLGYDRETFRLLETTKAAGAMFARSWLRDPFLLLRFRGDDVPDANTGRRILFDRLLEDGMDGGARMEMAKMLWGAGSDEFRQELERSNPESVGGNA